MTRYTGVTGNRIAQPGGGDSAGNAFCFPSEVLSDEFNNYCILPGFVDVHVHLREPGFCYKETIATGTAAAAAGGFTAICAMPNLNPVPDSPAHMQAQLEAIEKDALISVYPYGAITEGQSGRQLADFASLPKAIAFTDDGRGVMSDELMKQAMIKAREMGRLIVAHCEDERYPRESSEAEYLQLKRDLDLVRKTGCSYHMCHVSTKESVELIRQAKAEGLDVTCETAPHYLTLTDQDMKAAIEEYEAARMAARPGRFKMNPPIKGEADRQALMEALQDGTIDMIATDHAPHSEAEKSGPFQECAYGIVGLETAFPVLYTRLVLEGIITLDRLVELMSTAPARRFGIPPQEGSTCTVWDLNAEYEINPASFLSKGRSTPFEGWQVKGRCIATVKDGKTVYNTEKGGLQK